MEIRHFGQGAASEEILLYPHPNERIRHKAGDPAEGVAAYLHTDQLGSVRMVTDDDPDADGSMVARETTYRPFGEAVEFAVSLPPPETKGFIGERFDADAGLQYLNARYYDPRLGMFIQPDWFEVTKAGVGTNRHAYSGNDPVNISDPNGNCPLCIIPAIIGAYLASVEPANAPIGSDGNPVVLHHRDQKREGPLDEMTATSHRAVDHPKSPSEIDRPIFKGERARHWRERARTLLGQ